MYLFKNYQSSYYARLYIPLKFSSIGLPKEIRFSLFTKQRKVAIRHLTLLLAIFHSWLSEIEQTDASSLDSSQVMFILKKRIRQLQLKQFISPEQLALLPKSFTDFHQPKLPNPQKSHDACEQANQAFLDTFLEEKQSQNLRHSSIEQLDHRIRYFLTFLNAPVTKLTRQQALNYEKHLYAMQRSVKTQKDYLASAKQFGKWLFKQGYLKENFLEILTIKVASAQRRNPRDMRQRWQIAQLKQLFNHPEYLRCTQGHLLYQKEAQNYWIPLLLLFSGARANEICQLQVKDVRCIDGIWCIDIHAQEQHQQLKNENATRIVPIHSALIEVGFIQYLEQRKGCQQLFELSPTQHDNNWSKAFGQRFGKLLTRCGFTQKDRPTLHSFRHTFIDEMQQAGVEEHVTSELVGHAKRNITYGRYGKRVNLRQLKVCVELCPNFIAMHKREV